MSSYSLLQVTKTYRAGQHRFTTVGANSELDDPLADQVDNSEVETLSMTGGNVGLGTSLPAYKLHVEGSVYASGTLIASNLQVLGETVTLNTTTCNTEQLLITNSGTGPAIQVTQTGPQPIADFYDDANVLVMRVADGGNVGIGTSHPYSKLQVEGDISLAGSLLPTQCNIYDLGSSNLRWKNLFLVEGGIYLGDVFVQREMIDAGGLRIMDVDTGATTQIHARHVYTDDSVFASGNIGIGTTATASNLALEIYSTTGVLLPKGTTYERPYQPPTGVIRYNTDTSLFEGYGAGDVWRSIEGLKSTDLATYITPELSAGANDSNLRFVTADQLRMIIRPDGNIGIGTATPLAHLHLLHEGVGDILRVDDQLSDMTRFVIIDNGNVGIGTELPRYTLDVDGGEVSTSNAYTSNLTIYGNFHVQLNSTMVRTRMQVHHQRKIFYVEQAGESNFLITYPGAFTGHQSNVQVFVGRNQLTYVNSNIKDYDVTVTYNAPEFLTEYTITLTEPAMYGDVVDIIVWPQITQNSPENQGLIYMNANYFDTFWQQQGCNIGVRPNVPVYVQGNVGIGTTLVHSKLDVHGDMRISGHIIPWSCNTYDLGSSNYRFKDLYLSGKTIDLGGTLISRDDQDGGLMVHTMQGDPLDTSVRNLYTTSNIGIGTTVASLPLQIYGTSAILLPRGTDAERPTGMLGIIRFNTQTQQFEGFGAGNTWGSLGGVKSTDQTTYISAESSPSANDSNLRFYTGSAQHMIITPIGRVGVGTTDPTQKLHVEGKIYAQDDITCASNIYATGTLYTSNLVVLGENVTMNTITSNTERMVIQNAGTGPALEVSQSGIQPVADFYDSDSRIAVRIGNDGYVGFGTALPLAHVHIKHSGDNTDAFRVDDIHSAATPFVIKDSGYIGIGTTTPLTSLHIVGCNVNGAMIVNQTGTGPIAEFLDANIKKVVIDANGNVGIGTTQPNYPLQVTGGIAYFPDGIANPGLHAQWTLSGGGTVTWGSGYLLWSQRVIAIPVEKSEFTTVGYVDINCPTSGTITYYDSTLTTLTCTASGIPLAGWRALWYIITPGQGSTSDQTKFVVTSYTNSDWRPNSNWILIAVCNGDNTSLKWLPQQQTLNNSTAYEPSSEVGKVCYFARNTAPTGWLKANGAAISRTTYAALFAAIGTTFGVGDNSTTFNIPDLRGEFIRSWDDGRTVDNGRAFGSAQAEDYKSHNHSITDPGHTHQQGIPTGGALVYSGCNSGGQYNLNQKVNVSTSTTGITINNSGGTETRPRNVALLACIKY